MAASTPIGSDGSTASPAVANDRWPPQIKYIVGNEACERFSFYGMKSILAGYIAGKAAEHGLDQGGDRATEVIHLFGSATYFMPLFGAWLSDKVIGRYHTILWVSLLYCLGHGVLACSDFAGGTQGKLFCLYAGLTLIALGAGGIKPCVSAFVGDQFTKDQGHLLQKAYGAFYWSINFGSFFSFLVIPWVKNRHGYSAAFAVPGILMGVATYIFWRGTKYYKRVPPTRETKSGGFLKVFFNAYANQTGSRVGPLLNVLTTLGAPLFIIITLTVVSFSNMSPVMRAVGWSAIICTGLWYASVLVTSLLGKLDLGDPFWNAARKSYSESEILAARSVMPILFVFALIPVFWSLFDQTNSTWVLQGNQMSPAHLFTIPSFHLFGWAVAEFKMDIGAEQMQSMNALLVMILVPVFTLVIYPMLGKFASPLRRMSSGLFLTAASYVIVAEIQRRIDAGAKLNVMWQTVPYIVITASEVLVSTTGLEFAFREASAELKSTIMSFWLLTVTVGGLFVVGITKLFSEASAGNESASVSPKRFMLYAGLTFVVALLFSVVAAKYKYRDKTAAEGK